MESSHTSFSPNENNTEESVEPRKGPSECEICYRPAHGHHCGVASSQLQLRCQACRYKKCIQVGMDPLSLELKEGEDKASNYKKVKKREKEAKEDKTKNVTIRMVESKENQSKRVTDTLIYLDLKFEQFRGSAYNPSFAEYQNGLTKLIECSNKFPLSDKFGPVQEWPPIEICDLPRISRMRNIPDVPPSELEPNLPNEKPWMFFTMLTMVEYAKTFLFFHKLDLQDRIVLIGHVTLVCMNLHNSYFAVTRKIEGCLYPDGSEQPQKDEYHYPAYSMSIAPLIRCNVQKIEYVLLKAICLCNPTINGLSDHAQKIIGTERQQYADILLDYCMRNHKNGPSRFVELLGILSVIENQQRIQKDIHIYHIAPLVEKFGLVLNFLSEIMFS